ncbi:hypothetical protein M3202_05115 [Alkalihalobacillus oceani]|uniref:Uncharacterized protein n=1 Tax=Halalkalibacter oceani TaxID=1653776 RepID=A0A9X2DMD8_9BACI|nr:hypothetical protein [Halalkalibacter oceani]MCM3713454.1 hypothetical protein [Halalkalibacter oceani]
MNTGVHPHTKSNERSPKRWLALVFLALAQFLESLNPGTFIRRLIIDQSLIKELVK